MADPSFADSKLEIAALSEAGSACTDNQDFTGEFEDPDGNRLLIVADGMGGARGGAMASRLCVQTIGEIFAEGVGRLSDRLRYGMELANERVAETADQLDLEGMGTTAVALALAPRGPGVIAWVGDSRGYRLREGRLQPLTHDHSLVAEWVRAGELSADEAKTHPRRNELLRSIGAGETVDVDVVTVDVRPGDRFLLCSDGLSGHVSAAQIADALGAESVHDAATRLTMSANATGGFDNVTVQIAGMPGRSESAGRTRFSWRGATLGAALVLLAVGFGFAFRQEKPELPQNAAIAPEPAEPAVPLPTLAELARPPFDPDNPFGASEADPIAEEDPELLSVRPSPFIADRFRAPPIRPPTSSTFEEIEELAPVAAAPPTRTRADLPTEIERFLAGWKQTVLDKDYAGYGTLGFPSSQRQFDRDYAGGDADLSLLHLGHVQTEPGLVKLRVRSIYQHTDVAGAHHAERLHRILLRQTDAGLVYAGTWD